MSQTVRDVDDAPSSCSGIYDRIGVNEEGEGPVGEDSPSSIVVP